MTTELFGSAVKAWNMAAAHLGIRVESPYPVNVGEHRQFAVAYLPNFGSPNGMIVDGGIAPHYAANPAIRGYAKENDMYYSVINLDFYQRFERNRFVEALMDWGYFGTDKPSWMAPDNDNR